MDCDGPRRQKLVKLCILVLERLKAEQAYEKAQWRVSYYRKLKTKLQNSKKISERWSELTELTKKIESERLNTLKKQKHLAQVTKRLNWPIAKLKNELMASFILKGNGHVEGILVENTTLDLDKIVALVDQYEADKALTKALEDN